MFKIIKNVNKIKAKPLKFFSLLSLITTVDHREWGGLGDTVRWGEVDQVPLWCL